MKYTDIKDIRSLDSAQELLAGKLDAKGREIGRLYENAKDSYSPLSIFAGVLKRASYKKPYDKILLGIVRTILHRLKA